MKSQTLRGLACATLVAVPFAGAHGQDLLAGGSVFDNGAIVTSPTAVVDREAQLRNVLTRSDRRGRAFFEFDVSDFAGGVITDATISSGFFEQAGGGSSVAPAEITYFLYGADGSLTTGDYDNLTDPVTEAVTIGSVVRPDGSGGWTVDISGTDVTAAVQGLLDSGFTTVGFGAQLSTTLNFTATGLFAREIDLNVVPAPGAVALLGLGGLAAARRRR